MAQYRICVYAITKNEGKFVERWMDSMSEADIIVVTDTGSTDNTVQELRNRGAIVHEEVISPWRFDVARNLSLDHVPHDVDICVCTDLDEVFVEGWREKLELAWKPEAKTGRYLYNWSLKEDGTPDVQLTYFKVHSRHDYRWACPVHEYLQYIGTEPQITVYIDGMVLNHYPDAAKSRGSYLPLLEMAVEEQPQNDRMVYYLGREYMYKGMWEKCHATLKGYLTLPSATWREERCAAMRWLAKASYRLSNITEAYTWYYKAVAEVPHMRDAYVECAQMAYELGDWPTVFYMASEALKINQRSPFYTNMGYAWDHTPDDLCAIACYRLEMYQRSLDHANAAFCITPGDKRLAGNIELIKEKL